MFNCAFKKFIFICGFSAKVTWTFHVFFSYKKTIYFNKGLWTKAHAYKKTIYQYKPLSSSLSKFFYFLFYSRLMKRCLVYTRFELSCCLIIKNLTYGCRYPINHSENLFYAGHDLPYCFSLISKPWVYR